MDRLLYTSSYHLPSQQTRVGSGVNQFNHQRRIGSKSLQAGLADTDSWNIHPTSDINWQDFF